MLKIFSKRKIIYRKKIEFACVQKIKKISLILVFLLFLGSSLQSKIFSEGYKDEVFSIGNKVEIFEDQSKQLTIQEILTPEIQSQFQANQQDIIFRKTFDYAYWIKVQLQSYEFSPLWLELPSENLWFIDLYDLKNRNYELTYATGSLRPSSSKIHDSYILPILEFTGSKTVYIRLETKRLLIAPIYIGSLEDLVARKRLDYYILGTFIGLQIGLLLYSFLLLNLSSRSFFWFAGYTFMAIIVIPFLNHQIVLLDKLGDKVAWFFHKNYFILVGLLIFFSIQYAIAFLRLKLRNSKLAFLLNWIGVLLCLVLPISKAIFPTLDDFTYRAYPWITAAFGLILFAVSYYIQLVFRDKSVRFFTLSLVILASASLLHNLTNQGFIPYKFIFSRALYFGVGLASVFIALSITDRLFFKQQKLFSKRRKLDSVLYRKRLRQSVEDFEELIRVIPVGIYRSSKFPDESLKFTYVSPKWCELNGLSREEILKYPSLAINTLHPEDLPSFLEANLKATTNEERFLWEGRILVSGKVKFVHIESYPVKKPDGRTDWIGIEYDITEKNLQDKDLQVFAKLADSTSDAVVITNSEGQIIWINYAFTEITGYTLQEALGKTPGNLLHGPETSPETRARLHFAIHNFQPIREIILNYNKEGKPYWADLTINPIFDEEGKCCNFIGIHKNVTEQVEETLHLKKEFQELEQEKKKVLRYVHQKSEFLAAMSHEIRTPLNAIVGFTDLLSDTLKDESQKYFLQSIQNAVKNLMEVVNNILDYTKIEAGKVKLEFFETDVNEMFSYCLGMISTQAQMKGLQLIKKIDSNLPSKLFFDSVKVRQVLINILSNAVKFTMSGEIELGAKLESHESELGLLDITFYVRDTGIGIVEEKHQSIFEAFSQEDSSIQRDFGGTGLGLAICNRLLDLMGSQLELKSSKGKGSLFYFTVVAKENVSNSISRNVKQVSQKEINLDDIAFKVLVVDDLDVNRFLLMSLLKNFLPKATVFEASNGMQAIELYEQELPELVLLDIQMPDLNGYEVAKRIRKLEKEKKAVLFAVSAGNMSNEEELSLRAGINKYLTKPISKRELKESIFEFFKSA